MVPCTLYYSTTPFILSLVYDIIACIEYILSLAIVLQLQCHSIFSGLTLKEDEKKKSSILRNRTFYLVRRPGFKFRR